MAQRPWDVVLYGATGFTGRQTARYFAAHAPPGLRWAVAGRNRARLEQVRAEARAPGLIVADSADAAGIDAMAAATRVLLTTAGPFARCGTPVVDACVRRRTDYVDITGETGWVRGLVERHHAQAAADGTRVVPFCGFDSVPSDIGTLQVATWIREQWGQETRRVSASFALRGGFNGGTLATALLGAETGELLGQDVLLLNPPGLASDAERARSADFRGLRRDPDRGVWLAPFVMARINTRVVRRSNALLTEYGDGYGAEFAYEEAMEQRTRAGAAALMLGTRAGELLLSTRPGRELVRRLGPKPGEGPSERTQEHGFMRVRFVGEAADGRKVLATLRAKGDPGNRITVMILCEAALALATQRDSLPGAPRRGGVLTPATALGLPLLQRLEAAGMQLEMGPLGSARS